jgi:hypothetical protein
MSARTIRLRGAVRIRSVVVGDDPEGAVRQPPIDDVRDDDATAAAGEALVEYSSAPGVQLDGDDARTGRQQWCGDATGSGTEIDDEISGACTGVADQAPGLART